MHIKLVAIIPNKAFRQQMVIYIAFEQRYDYTHTAIGELMLEQEPNNNKVSTTQQQPLMARIPTLRQLAEIQGLLPGLDLQFRRFGRYQVVPPRPSTCW